MNKTNLIPFKHILISREGEIYWYIDENVIESKHHKDILYDKCNMISLCTDCNRIFDEEWEGNLLAKRSEYGRMEARKKDIIFVYEIIDHYDFLNIIRNIRYTQPTDYEEYMGRSCVKLIYERIDGVMETD